MNTTPSSLSYPEDQENILISPRFGEFKEALEALYMFKNHSGRLHFMEKWPETGTWIFGADLLRYDQEGTTDIEHRAALEEEAETRRAELIAIMESLEAQSVKDGALQTQYVQELVNKFGRDLSLHLYREKVVDRFAPPPPKSVVEAETQLVSAPALPEEEIMQEFPDDPLADVQPIDVQKSSMPPVVKPEQSSPMTFISSKDNKPSE